VKRSVLIAFCVLGLCSLLLANAGSVKAATASGYERTDTPTNTTYPNTVDGLWNPPEEWYDANFTGTNATIIDFGSTWDMGTYVTSRWIIEFFTDNTTDAGDYWEICTDTSNVGGAEPASTDFRIRIDGHDTLTVYQGNAGSWDVITPDADELVWNNSITTTPWSSDPHWILEIDIAKNGAHGFAGITWGVRVAAYDASNATQGEVAWPPASDADVPDGWATQNYAMSPDGDYWETVPEGFSIAIVVLLSTAALVVGFYFLRKKSTTGNLGKTGNISSAC
jgi:hypothetical protein